MDGFEIISKLGDGSYSVVYKVKRKADNNIYALKKVNLQKLSKKERENSLNEVRILASIKSNFVISYKEAFIEESDKSLCLVMEYADKGDLYQKIVQFKKKGCLIEEVDVWKIFIQMTKGLKAIHDLQILHRDLKSANIFLFSDGSAKIGDLNVSKVVHLGMGVTQTGTPYYASPEVWENKPYDSKSDIWSLGCVTYEMLTLHPPFRAEDMDGLYNKVMKGEYPKINKRYSNDISELIQMLLQVRPEDRPSCQSILKHPLIIKRLEFFQAQAGIEFDDIEGVDENQLLKTIRIPKDILGLGERLPKADYNFPNKKKKHIKIDANKRNNSNDLGNKDSNKNNSESLPNINTNNFNSQSVDLKNNKININSNGKTVEIDESVNNLLAHYKNKIKNSIHNLSPSENEISNINMESINKANIKNNITILNKKEQIKNPILENQLTYRNKINNNNKKQKDLKSYFESIGLGHLYKIYAPQLEGQNKIYNRKYNNYINKNITTKKGLPNIYIINNNNYNINTNNYNRIGTLKYSIEKKRGIRKYY